MSAMSSLITSLTIVYSNVYSGADQRKHQSSASLAFVRVIHRWPVNSPHKGPVMRKMFPFDDVIMIQAISLNSDKLFITSNPARKTYTFPLPPQSTPVTSGIKFWYLYQKVNMYPWTSLDNKCNSLSCCTSQSSMPLFMELFYNNKKVAFHLVYMELHLAKIT